MRRNQCWVYLVVCLAVTVPPERSLAGEPPGTGEIEQRREKQLAARREVEQTAQRYAAMLRVLAYHRLDEAAERHMLAEVAGQLGELNRNDMDAVLRHLDEALKAPQAANAAAAVDAARDRHLGILLKLRGLLGRYQAVQNLDQAADRLDELAAKQLALAQRNAHIQAEARDYAEYRLRAETIPPARQMAGLVTRLTEVAEQTVEIRQDLESLAKQVEALAEHLNPHELDRWRQVRAALQERRVLAGLHEVASKIREQRQRLMQQAQDYGLLVQQRKLAHDLRVQAGVLKAPQDPTDQLRRAVTTLGGLADNLSAARIRTSAHRDPRWPDHEKRRLTGTGERLGTSAFCQQLQHSFELVAAEVQAAPVAPEVVPTLRRAAELAREVEHQMHQGRFDWAHFRQSEMLAHVLDALAKLQKSHQAAVLARTDPLARLQQLKDQVRQLRKDQEQVRQQTKDLLQGRQMNQRAKVQRQQEQLQERSAKLAAEPSPAPAEAIAALHKATTAMQNAQPPLRELASQAVARQDTAIDELQNAEVALNRQIAQVQQRRQEMTALDKALEQLHQLDREQTAVAQAADDLAKTTTPAPEATAQLAQREQQAQQQTQKLARELQPLAPAGTHALERAATRMDETQQALRQPDMPAAQEQAHAARPPLAEALAAAEAALKERQTQELADQAAMQPGQVRPATAAAQIQKALEQTEQAMRQTEQACKECAHPGGQAKAEQSAAAAQAAAAAAQAALSQAQAQVPSATREQLQQAHSQLGSAGEALGRQQPEAARQAEQSARQQMERVIEQLQALERAMAQRERANPREQPPGEGEGDPQPGDKPSDQNQPGQSKPNPGNQKPDPKASERDGKDDSNQRDGTGKRQPGGGNGQAGERAKLPAGDDVFIGLQPRQRDLIKQALADKLPPEYAALIEQYYIRLTQDGKTDSPSGSPRPGPRPAPAKP